MMKRIFALVLALCLCLPMIPTAEASAYKSGTFTSAQGRFLGIDVSEHQGQINWDSVKASGIKFAIIRAGYGQNYTSQDDGWFRYNVKECNRVGIPFGLYLYNYATSVSGASGEADHAIRLINECKSYSNFRLPMYYDLEENSVFNLGASTIKSMMQTFEQKVESATGVTVGVYANTNWFNNRLTDSYYKSIPCWVAQYNSSCQYTGTYDIWQYSSSGSVGGISGRCDMNYARVDSLSDLYYGSAAPSATATVVTDKTTYKVGEAIMVTANSNASDAWVGVYPQSNNLSASLMWYWVSDYAGEPVNVLNGKYTGDKGYESRTANTNVYLNWGDGFGSYMNDNGGAYWGSLKAGTYTVGVYTGDGGTPLASKTITISGSGFGSSLSTDKTLYYGQESEHIYVTATSDNPKAWVGLYKSSVTDYANNPSYVWYSLYGRNKEVTDICWDYSGYNPQNGYSWPLANGTYKVVLFSDSGYTVDKTVTFTIGNPTLSTDKSTYCVKQPIKVSTNYTSSGSWIGLYGSSNTPGTHTSLYWYYTGTNKTSNVDIKSETNERGGDFGAGTYKLIQFADSTYSKQVATKTITVKACTDGNNDHKCDYCGTTVSSCNSNAQSNVLASSATCTAAATYYKKCSVCGKQSTATYSSGNALGHNYTEKITDASHLKTAATCTKAAEYYYDCSRCSKSSKGDTNATFTYGSTAAHNENSTSTDSKYLKTAATCTAAAVYYKSCSVCGAKGTSTFTSGNPAAHDYTKQIVSNDYLKSGATHTAAATYYYACAACNRSSSGDTNASYSHGEPIAHTFDRQVAEAGYLKSEATCTAKAVYYSSCSCGTSSKGTESEATFTAGDFAQHDFTAKNNDEKYLKAPATEDSAAEYFFSCSACGEKGSETFFHGDPLPHVHSFTAETVDAKYLKNEATCTAKAVYYVSCASCGDSSKGTESEATFTAGDFAQHDFTAKNTDEKYLKAPATEDSAEEYFFSCSACGEKGSETFFHGDPLVHVHSFTAETVDAKYLKNEATCTAKAFYYVSCASCGDSSKGTDSEATFTAGDFAQHDFTAKNTDEKYLKAPATEDSAEEYFFSCSACGEKGSETFFHGEPLAHVHDYCMNNTDEKYLKSPATEDSAAIYYHSCSCGESSKGTAEERVFTSGPPLVHSHDFTRKNVSDQYLKAPATCTGAAQYYFSCVCGSMSAEYFTQGNPAEHSYVDGKCEHCEKPEGEPNEDETPEGDDVIRVAGENRFETAFQVADQMKELLDVEKFENIVVASGADFADALSGSYLAAVKNAPILLTYKASQNALVQAYILENLDENGTVYILGGTAAVPASMEEGLEGLNVKRLAGANRFETNIEVLKEAGVPEGEEILVCTGTNFADCLSASATCKPILLVYKRMMPEQEEFLRTLSDVSYCIIGGENAVNMTVANVIDNCGPTIRLSGSHRYQTSVLVAERFFDEPDKAVLAYARNFPDGLCGGALAAAAKAPLILTDYKYYSYAAEYTNRIGIHSGYVLGGDGLVSDKAAGSIFDTDSIFVYADPQQGN